MNEGSNSRIEQLWRDIETDLSAVNSLGRVPLHYRTVDYGRSLERMVRRLPSFAVESTTGIIQPLRTLRIDDGQSWVMALLESWALVAEVLGFYQERMANEGFLASAVQEISVRELLRMVGYQPFPGTAGSSLSVFLTSGASGMPEVVDIPKGARIQGVPLGGELPQIFQTNAALGGRAEWNQMSAFVPRIQVAPPLDGSSRTIELAGYETSLKPGDPLLLKLTPANPQVRTEPTMQLRVVEKAKRKKGSPQRSKAGSNVTPARKTLRGFDSPATEVTLTEPLEGQAATELALEQAYKFNARAHLFGYNAPKWSQVPDRVRRQYAPIQGGIQVSADDGTSWRSADDGLPEVEIRCLVAAGPRLFAGTSKGLYRRSDDDSLGSTGADSSNPNGSDPGSTAPGSRDAEGSGSDDSGWALISNGIGRVQISALATLSDEESGDHIWVADSRGQVYQSSDGGVSFSPVQGRVQPQVAGLGALIKSAWDRLAKPLHLELEAPARPALPVGTVHALAAMSEGGELFLFAGMDKGVFCFALPASGWRATSTGLPGADAKTGQASTSVRALQVEKSGCILLGCNKGFFRSRNAGKTWHAAERGLPDGTQIQSLTGYADKRRRRSTFFAGSQSGIYRSDDPERGWSAASLGLIDPAPDASGPPQVDVLTSRLDPVDLTHHIFAGTPAGLFRSSDLGESWGLIESLQPISKIDAVTTDRVGRVLAAMPFAGFATDEWPGFHLLAGAIDLDRIYPHVVSGGWVVLQQPASVGGLSTAIFKIVRVVNIERQDFELDSMVTRLEVDDDGTLSTFDLRSTQVFLSSQALEPWQRSLPDLRPVYGSQVRVAPALKNLPENERRVIVTGRRIRARLRAGAWQAQEKTAQEKTAQEKTGQEKTGQEKTPDRSSIPEASESLQVLALQEVDGHSDVRVRDRLGRVLALRAESLEWLPADDDDEIVGQPLSVLGGLDSSAEESSTAAESPTPATPSPETSTAESSTSVTQAKSEKDDSESTGHAAGSTSSGTAQAREGESFTTLRLGDPLAILLDPTTVSIWGNVSPASQGQTLSHAIGSGDAARSFQRFAIDQPVTYMPTATEDGFRSTLEIEVAGATWREVPHLCEVESSAHVFMVRPDLSGRSLVIFGDGENGARLPTGRNNVVATYRSGMWPQPLAPHQLSILQTRPLGLRYADNPLATEPGAPAEQRGASRQRMPAWLRPLGRIVSLRDFQDFVSQNTAVARALVALLVVRAQGLIQITIAGQGGDWISPTGEIYRQLAASIEAQRAPGEPVRLQNYEPAHWLIALRLQIEKDSDKAAVTEQVRTQIGLRFGFDEANFGQRIYIGQLVDTALSVDGVLAAEATRFGILRTGWSTAEKKDPQQESLATADAANAQTATGYLEAASDFQMAPAGRIEAQLASVDRSSGIIQPAQLLRLAKVELELST